MTCTCNQGGNKGGENSCIQLEINPNLIRRFFTECARKPKGESSKIKIIMEFLISKTTNYMLGTFFFF